MIPTYFLLPAKAIGMCGLFFLAAVMAAYWLRFDAPLWSAL